MSRRLKAYLLLLAATAIWGVAGVVIKFTLDGIDPLPFLTYRFGISAFLAVGYFLLLKHKLPKSSWPIIILYSLFSTTFALGALFLGVDRTTVLNLSLLGLSLPLITELAGVFFLGDKITKREKTGTAIAIVGVLFTIVEPILEGNGRSGTFLGNTFIALYAFFDIASVILLKKILRTKVSGISLSQVSFVVGFASLLPIAVFILGAGPLLTTIVTLPLKYQLGVWFMAVFSGTIAYTLRAKAQKTIEVSEGALFGYLTSIFGVPLAVVWLKESVTSTFIMGAVVIALGVYIAEKKN